MIGMLYIFYAGTLLTHKLIKLDWRREAAVRFRSGSCRRVVVRSNLQNLVRDSVPSLFDAINILSYPAFLRRLCCFLQCCNRRETRHVMLIGHSRALQRWFYSHLLSKVTPMHHQVDTYDLNYPALIS